MKLSIFYDHLREACEQASISMTTALKIARANGIEGIEICLSCLLEQETEIMKEIQNAGMKLSSIYEFYDWGKEYSEDKARAHVDTAARYGVNKILVVPGFLKEDEAAVIHQASSDLSSLNVVMSANTNVTNMKEALLKITDYAANKHITVTLEDFDSSLAPYSKCNELLWYLTKVPELRFTMDTGNFAFSDESAWEGYQRLQSYIVHIHCKDRKEENPGNKGLPPNKELSSNQNNRGLLACPTGAGYMPIKEIVTSQLQSGYDGYFAIEHFGAESQLEYLKQSADFLHSLSDIE